MDSPTPRRRGTGRLLHVTAREHDALSRIGLAEGDVVVDRGGSEQQGTPTPPEFVPVKRKPGGVTLPDVPGTIQVQVALVGTINRHWESHFNTAKMNTASLVQQAKLRGQEVVANVTEDQLQRWPEILDDVLARANDLYKQLTVPELDRAYREELASRQDEAARSARLRAQEQRMNEER